MNGGDLQKRIKDGGQMEESTAKYYFIQLVLAVKYLHQQGIVHRDLKPENILMSSQNENAILKVISWSQRAYFSDATLLPIFFLDLRFWPLQICG